MGMDNVTTRGCGVAFAETTAVFAGSTGGDDAGSLASGASGTAPSGGSEPFASSAPSPFTYPATLLAHVLEGEGRQDALTARVVRTLAAHPEGLIKPDLLVLFYPDYPRASEQRRASLETCLNKLLQRARRRYAARGVEILYDRASSRWQVKFLQGRIHD